MKIEVVNEKSQPNNWEFPVLMEHKMCGAIVMFHSPTKGTVLNKTEAYKAGHYQESWFAADATSHWTRFTGKITLSND